MQRIEDMHLIGSRKPLSLAEAAAIAVPNHTPSPAPNVAQKRVTTPASPVSASPPTRDDNGALWITEAQAAAALPPGRYRYRNAVGSVITIERGESACALGRKLRVHSRSGDAMLRQQEHEKAIQKSWLRRC
jgi:hypothetical protein